MQNAPGLRHGNASPRLKRGNITAIIKELGYKLEQWKKPHKRKLNRLIKEKTQTIKAAGIAKDQNKPEEALNKLQSRIIRLEKQAQKVQKDMKSKGVHASSEKPFFYLV